MKTLSHLIFCTALLLLCGSCQKNIDAFIPDNTVSGIDTVWQNNIASNASIFNLKNDLRLNKVTDSFTLSSSAVIFSPGNISLTIPPNSLTKNNGTVITGLVQRETLLINKKGDFIAMDIPTVSNDRLLVNSAAFFLQLKNNGDHLSIAQGNKIGVKFNATNAFPINRIFNPSADTLSGFNWILNNDTAFNKSAASSNGYEIQTNRTQFVLSAHFMDTVGVPQTILTVKLPANYTNSNTLAYLSFNTLDAVAGLKPNVGLHAFISPLLPVNRSATVVILSKQAGDYYLGTLQLTTSTNASSNVFITPVKRSLEYIKNYLTGL